MAWEEKKVARTTMKVRLRRDWQLYALMFVPLLYIAIFRYAPIFGLQIAFKEFDFGKGIWGSPWVGLTAFYLHGCHVRSRAFWC